MFGYSLKLLGSNWQKALKLFLYYIVVGGICFALFLPAFFEFKALFITNFKDAMPLFSGVFGNLPLGDMFARLINISYQTFLGAAVQNIGLFIYGLIVIFVFFPFLINLGKFAFSSMLYSYMTSLSKIGFFSAMIKTLSKALLYSLCKTIYNFILWTIVFVACFGIGMIPNAFFTRYFLPLVLFVILVVAFALNQLSVLGWMSALIVFDCNVFSAYKKGFKAVKRHFWTTLAVAVLCFFWFWLLTFVFGFYSLAVLIPFVGILLCVQNMAAFFSSQGMRFYYTSTNILTPKKLEEVDNINKTAYIL